MEFSESDLKRFWDKVDVGNENECWNWKGCKDPNGYGLFFYRNENGKDKVLRSARIVYQLFFEEPPIKSMVYHKCKIASCCNPKHLLLKLYELNKISYDPKLLDLLYKNIIVDANSGCWIWIGDIHESGYGVLKYNGFPCKPHRISYMIFNDKFDIIPDEKICHICDNKLCCNPNHLFLGSQKDNVHDMENKKRSRHPNGSDNGNSKLNESDVLSIRNEYFLGKISRKELALKYNVKISMIGFIILNKNWKNVGGPIRISKKGKICIEIAREMRELYTKSKLTLLEISKIYNVSDETVRNVVNYKTWKEQI